MTNGWLKLEKSLLKVVQVKNAMTGESIEWTHVHTILLLYMLDRYRHFKKMGREFYDNQENIAQETGIPLRSLSRRMKELYKIGAVRIEKKKIGGYLQSNSYTVLDVFVAQMFEAITSEGEILEKFTEAPVPAKASVKLVRENIIAPEVKRNKWGIGETDPEAPF